MTSENQDLQREEELLKNALVREDPSSGFAAQVLARAARSDAAKDRSGVGWYGFLFRPVVRWGAVATISASLIAGAVHYRNVRRERTEGEAAKQQLMLALHIAGSKLQLARAKVNQINTDRQHVKPENNRSRSKS